MLDTPKSPITLSILMFTGKHNKILYTTNLINFYGPYPPEYFVTQGFPVKSMGPKSNAPCLKQVMYFFQLHVFLCMQQNAQV